MRLRTALIISFITVLALPTLGLSATKAQPSSATKGFNNSKALVVSKPGQQFEIKIPGNPTTGYLWFLKSFDGKLITPLKHKYEAPKSNMLGAPGKDVWTFKARPEFFTVPQITVLEFYSARPFDIRKGKVLKLALISQPPELKVVQSELKTATP